MTRLSRLTKALRRKGRLPYLVFDLVNIGYLTGFRGTNACLVLDGDRGYLISDSRYEEYARSILPPGIDFVLQKKDLAGTLKTLGRRLSSRRLFFEEHGVTYSNISSLKKGMARTKLLPGGDEVNALRLVKEDEEIAAIRKAVNTADECLSHLLGIARPDVREWDLSIEIENFYRKRSCRRSSFDSIVASGNGSSMPHYVTSMSKRIEAGDVLLIDMGCELDGYNSDLTRTVFVRSLERQFDTIYRVVKEAQEAAISAIRPGITSGEVDKTARDIIGTAGFGWAFGHSLGHGLGLEVHELPALKSGGRTRLREGMVLTVEPGIYLPGRGGVRIEDVVVVTAGGCEILTGSPKEIRVI